MKKVKFIAGTRVDELEGKVNEFIEVENVDIHNLELSSVFEEPQKEGDPVGVLIICAITYSPI